MNADNSLSTEFKYIVRLLGKDLNGSRKVIQALSKLKGVGNNLAHYLLISMHIDSKARIGDITDGQIAEIEKRLKNSGSLGLPDYMINRRKDLESGSNIHLVGSELDFSLRTDREREKSMASWRGVRSSLGLKVRGQRTRTSGRKGKTIGVKKTALARSSEKK